MTLLNDEERPSLATGDSISDVNAVLTTHLKSETEAYAAPSIVEQMRVCESDEQAAQVCKRMMVAFSTVGGDEIPIYGDDFTETLRTVYADSRMIPGLADDLGFPEDEVRNNLETIVFQLGQYANNHERQHRKKAEQVGWQHRYVLFFYKDEYRRPHGRPATIVAPSEILDREKLLEQARFIASEIEEPSKRDSAIQSILFS